MSDTVFKQVNYQLGDLVGYVELGEIGLPDIQRPFVWKNAKFCGLFHSMFWLPRSSVGATDNAQALRPST